MFSLDVGPIAGPGALPITIQRVVASMWIGIGVGKAITLPQKSMASRSVLRLNLDSV